MGRVKLANFFLALSILASGAAWAQTPSAENASEWKRAATTHRLAAFPKVHPDGRVWFEFAAPNAQKVELHVGAANKTSDMTKNKDGVWSAIIPYPGPGFQAYWFVVDGLIVADPSSDMFYQNGYKSVVEVPSPGEDYYLIKPVPHGDVREHWFHSKVTGEYRRMFVYTPPGYDANPRARYPVLYLQHGAGENEAEWTHSGLANFILDNLLAEKKAVPMIIVMNNGFAFPPGTPMPLGPRETRPASVFEQMLLTEVIPDIDANFRTLADREHRAMTGLSMGGMQTFDIAPRHTEMFSYIGTFSGPPLAGGSEEILKSVFDDAATFNKRVHLMWFAAGTAEPRFHNRAKEVIAMLNQAGIKTVFYESPETAHEWQTWRRCLHEFAPLLFKE